MFTSASVVIKWLWCAWTGNHPAGSYIKHQFDNILCYLELKKGLSLDHLVMFNSCGSETLHFVAPHHHLPYTPTYNDHLKNYLKWQAIQLAAHCRVCPLKASKYLPVDEWKIVHTAPFFFEMYCFKLVLLSINLTGLHV